MPAASPMPEPSADPPAVAERRAPSAESAARAGAMRPRPVGEPKTGSRSLNPFRTLQKHPNFRYFWFGQTLSVIGTWMQSVAEGWLALQLSNSAFVVGLVRATQSLPVLLLSLPAGVVADRRNKRRLVIATQALFLVQGALMWWFTWSGNVTIGWLLALAFFSGCINAFDVPSRQSFIVELVGREDLVEAIALNSSGFNMARIVGPSIAALVIAAFGLAWCFALNALSYVAVLAGLLMIRLPKWERSVHAESAMEGLREGFSYMRSTREVAVIMRLVAVYSILGMPYLTLMPVVAQDVVHSGAAGYGVLLSCVGIGAVIGAFTVAAMGRRLRQGRLLRLTITSFAVSLIAFSFMHTLALASAVLLVSGLTMIITNALNNSLLQRIVPDALRGRVMSAYTFVFIGLTPVGSFLGGAVAKAVGVDWTVAGGAVLLLAYVTWTFHRHPEIVRL